MDIGERIKKLRHELDLTQAKFAARIGSVQNTLTGYETGRRKPSSPVIAVICREFNVNEKWLRDGEGEMFVPSPSTALDALAVEYKLTHADRVLIEKYLNLKESARKEVINYLLEVVTALGVENVRTDSPKSFETLSIEDKVALYRAELEREEKVAVKSKA